ncbi:MAG: hypothetical protein HYY29_05665 [Chloroflexi bacterium]|nr:hypothetical protein [Chloroflexota bacterium]
MSSAVTDGVTGWRGTLGWVSPAIPTSVSFVDFHAVVPEGIEVKVVTLGITAHTAAEVEQALAKLDDAVKRLAIAGAQFISVEGTPLVTFSGFGFDREIIKRVESLTRVPATTSLSAAVDAMRTLNIKKITIASPMNHEADAKTRKFLEDNDFEVLNVTSLNKLYNRDIHALPRSAAYGVAKQAFAAAPQAEAVYLPCGAWCPPWCIDKIETDLGIPAIHSRQVATWAGLKSLGIKEPVTGWGKIFETLYKN